MKIKKVEGQTIVIECDHCNDDHTIAIDNTQLKFLPEFNQYENLNLQCPCGMTYVLNMNLPDDEYDESDLIPDDEWHQRHIIKNIRKMKLGESSIIETIIPEKKPFIERND